MNDIGEQIESGAGGPEWDGRARDLAQGVANSMQRATAVVDRVDTLSRQNVLLKNMLVFEYMKRGAKEQVYTAMQLDHAADQAKGWMIEPDGKGNYLAHCES